MTWILFNELAHFMNIRCRFFLLRQITALFANCCLVLKRTDFFKWSAFWHSINQTNQLLIEMIAKFFFSVSLLIFIECVLHMKDPVLLALLFWCLFARWFGLSFCTVDSVFFLYSSLHLFLKCSFSLFFCLLNELTSFCCAFCFGCSPVWFLLYYLISWKKGTWFRFENQFKIKT